MSYYRGYIGHAHMFTKYLIVTKNSISKVYLRFYGFNGDTAEGGTRKELTKPVTYSFSLQQKVHRRLKED